jgi:flagellar hook-associated protein FlgK
VENVSDAKATVIDQIAKDSGPPAAPLLGGPGGLANNPVPSAALTTSASRVVPFATVPAGLKDVVIYLDPGQGQADLQILTREGRHLLGTSLPDGDGFVANGASVTKAFEPGSTYKAEYLNKRGSSAFRDQSMFYGARAKPTSVEILGSDHVPLRIEQVPARLEAELPFASGGVLIKANSLKLNDAVSFPTEDVVITTPQQAAQRLNDLVASAASSTTATADTKAALVGITASVRDGKLVITRDPAAGPAGQKGLIEFGFGPQGNPQLFAKLGFRTAAYLDGAVREDLMVFTSGSGDVKIAASFSGQPVDASEQREQMRQESLQLEFIATNRYQIIDTKSQTVLAERGYQSGSAIDYRGLQIRLSADPKTADKFNINGNHDGLGDNGNSLRFVDLETQGVVGPGNAMSVGESYLDVVDQLANINQQAHVATKALEVVHQQAIEARESVSGVSLDEEAADLIRFQQAYQAAAKSMQVASQMFDAVLRI